MLDGNILTCLELKIVIVMKFLNKGSLPKIDNLHMVGHIAV